MSRLVKPLAVLAAALAAFGPLLPTFFPRLSVGIFYRLRLKRIILAALAVLAAIGARQRRTETSGNFGLVLTIFLAGISQVLDPKRFIIALDTPLHLPAGEAQLGANALVLGAEIAGQAVAWPFEMLVPRHLINDRVGSTPVLAAY